MEQSGISKKIGFLRPGWWIIHTIGISAVYAMGNLLWK